MEKSESKSEDEKRFNPEDVEYYIDPSNVPKDLLKSLRELKSKEFKAAETLFESLVKVTKEKADIARQMSSKRENVKYMVSIIKDQELDTFLKSMGNNLDDDKETKRLGPADTPREKLRGFLSSENAQDERKAVVQDFSEVQRRKVVLRSRLEDWYLQYSNLSQIYEPIRLEIKRFSDLATFSEWLRNVRAYFKRRRKSILRIKRRQHTHYKDDCNVSIREVLREGLESVRKMKSKWSELYVVFSNTISRHTRILYSNTLLEYERSNTGMPRNRSGANS